MFSITWNAPEILGMKPVKSFSYYDVVKNPKVEKFVSDPDLHLQEVLNF